MVLLRNEVQIDKQTYFDIGLQYYLSGRVAFIDQLFPVAGNLFHHAVEMFLKSALMSRIPPEILHTNFKHRILDLWVEYTKFNSSGERFHTFIGELSKWEELRYPKQRNEDVVMYFRMEKNESGLEFQEIPERKSRKFNLSLEEMDEFFQFVINIPVVSREYIKVALKLGVGNRIEDYKEFNKHTGDLLNE